MPDKKLTDSEIVKALECCVNEKTCKNCPYSGRSCMTPLKRDTLDLINRLKSENERLKQSVEDKGGLILIETAKAEAYKECIEKVREKLDDCRTVNDYVYQGYDTGDIRNMLDNLLKEMVGEDNAEEKE